MNAENSSPAHDPQRLESAYAALSGALDSVDPEKERTFLAKLALMLALRVPDHASLVDSIERCKEDL